MYVLIGYFNFFGTVGFSTDFLVELKLDIVKTKLSTVKHLQFYFLKGTNSRLFESMGDKKSVEPQCRWLLKFLLGRILKNLYRNKIACFTS